MIVKVNRISLACVVWEESLVTVSISRASSGKDPRFLNHQAASCATLGFLTLAMTKTTLRFRGDKILPTYIGIVS